MISLDLACSSRAGEGGSTVSYTHTLLQETYLEGFVELPKLIQL